MARLGTSRGGEARLLTLVVALVTAAALVGSGCAEQSNVAPDAPVAIHGTVLQPDGAPLADRPVRLGSGVTATEGGLGFLTVGLACFGGACSGDFFDATSGDDGTYRFDLTGADTQSSFGEATSFLLTTSAAPPADRPTGATVSARFRVQATDLALPDLALVDVRPELEAAVGGAIRATWDGAQAPAPYTLSFLSGSGEALWQMDVTNPETAIDGRLLEDVTGLATVSTRRADAIEGSDLEIVHRSSGVGFRGGFGPPPSRGVRCELHGDGGAIRPLGDCGVTDGSFAAASLPSSVCLPAAGEGTSRPACQPVARLRVLLDEPVPAQLVVVRGCSDPCRVATITGGGAQGAGAVTAPFGAAPLDEAPISGVDVVASDLSTLAEVSVWPAVQAEQPLLSIADPSEILAEPDDDSGSSKSFVAMIAAALAALAAILLGITIGRRSPNGAT